MTKIVVVDDDRGTRSLIRLILSDGTECFEASTAAEGLEVLQRIQPDLLIASES
jgi:CheY-like chemotaxis protein